MRPTTLFTQAQHDEHLHRGIVGARTFLCACCGEETVEIDDLGRCPSALCALASRIDNEVPSALLRFMGIALDHASHRAMMNRIADTNTAATIASIEAQGCGVAA